MLQIISKIQIHISYFISEKLSVEFNDKSLRLWINYFISMLTKKRKIIVTVKVFGTSCRMLNHTPKIKYSISYLFLSFCVMYNYVAVSICLRRILAHGRRKLSALISRHFNKIPEQNKIRAFTENIWIQKAISGQTLKLRVKKRPHPPPPPGLPFHLHQIFFPKNLKNSILFFWYTFPLYIIILWVH